MLIRNLYKGILAFLIFEIFVRLYLVENERNYLSNTFHKHLTSPSSMQSTARLPLQLRMKISKAIYLDYANAQCAIP